jgi:hypothetical protein
MKTCPSCGEIYVPQSSAWGEECGQCIAGKLELMLMGGLPARERLPMRRASDLDVNAERDAVEAPAVRRAVGE